MEDPCYTCLVRSCCTKYCDNKCLYNQKVKKMYLNHKNVHLFEQAVDDIIKVVNRKHPGEPTMSKNQIIRIILEMK